MKLKRWVSKYKNVLGLILCLCGLIFLHRNMIMVGLPSFIAGFLVFNNGKMPWGR